MSIRETIIAKGSNILNIYFTAGHPTLHSTKAIIKSLEKCGADLIEVGLPYSDPLADGLTIQQSSKKALLNGQNISNIFNQIREVRQHCKIPIMLMGYYNQFLQFGPEEFLINASRSEIQGMIIPDLPMDTYESQYKSLFEKYNIEISFMITPHTSYERILQADSLSSSFIYMVSQSRITGSTDQFSDDQIAYFQKIKDMQLKSPKLIGFGIHNRETRKIANQYAHGCIIGSAFIRILEAGYNHENIEKFISDLT